MSAEAKSTISLSKIVDNGVRKHGKALVSNLSIALKLSKLYSDSHQNVREALRELRNLLVGFSKLQGSAEVTRIDEFLFLNDVRIQVDLGGYENYQHITQLLSERDVGSIYFTEDITESELRLLVKMFGQKIPETPKRWAAFCKILDQYNLPNVTISQYEPTQEIFDDVPKDRRMIAIRSYFKAIACVGRALDALVSKGKLNLRSIKLAMQAMVDMTLNGENMLLALTNVKNFGRPGANHAINVAVLSIALGAKLGLSKKVLGELGMSAVLHDTGKVHLPDDLQLPFMPDLTSEQEAQYKSHVFSGVDRLLKQSLVNAVIKSMNVAFLHHYRYDRTGYPHLLVSKEQNLFSRIVAVANFYDNATTPRRLYEKPMRPEQVMRTLMDQGGTAFDPLVVKAFVNIMGLYPVGSMVQIDTGEVGTVVAPSTNPKFLDRPKVRILVDSNGNTSERIVNLMDRNSQGKFLHSIHCLFQQEEVEIELEEYLAVI